MRTKLYNQTECDSFAFMEKEIVHRDTVGAHYFRWSHILKLHKLNQNVLDFGCGSGNLAEMLYRNKHKCGKYLGLDIRKVAIESNQEKFRKVPWVEFKVNDLVLDVFNYGQDWKFIISFEVIEHLGKQNGSRYLQNIKKHMSQDTILLLSTPCYDANVGAAQNHMINGEVGEYTYDELKFMLEDNFEIINNYGTFASQKDYINRMNEWQQKMFDKLSEYYDSNLLSNIMAPLFPEHSRNCLWVCKLKW